MSNSKPLLKAREARILGYVKRFMAVNDIALREGLEPYYANKERNRIARANGIAIDKDYDAKVKGEKMPYGLTDDSRQFRNRLGDHVHHLSYNDDLSALELAHEIGIPQKHQHAARDKPNNYNWTLSQMERVARAKGIPFRDFMLQLLRE